MSKYDDNDELDRDGHLTMYDYEYLNGNKVFWSVGGAALNTVYEWCRSHGLGGFGDPTEKGLRKIKEYEKINVG